MVTKKERRARDRIRDAWPDFCDFVQGTLDGRHHGQTLQEADVEQMFERLAGDVLGYGPDRIGRQQDYADRTLHGQGMKLAVVEIKSYGAFERRTELDDALVQAARYADRHRTPNLVAFDGVDLVLALRRRDRDDVAVMLREEIDPDADAASENLFYFNHFGLFRYPKEEQTVIEYDATEDDELHRTHHGEQLHYDCYAHVGDLTRKSTWKLPYRTPDGTVDENRIGHAVNYLLSPGGYRGNTADELEGFDEGDRLLAALKLARAYDEVGKWEADRRGFHSAEKPSPVQLLWRYLYQNGVTADAV
ncbi:MAG: hypothetical protein ABEJ81_01065 [Haloferacaceae archaeon]